MELMAKKLTLPSDLDIHSEMIDLVTNSNPQTDPKGKRKVGQDPVITTTYASPSTKKLKVFKDPFLQIVDYPTPTMETFIGEHADTEKTLIEHYGSLKSQGSQEREITKEKLRSTQPPQLISSLHKKSQMMKITVIQPTTVGEAQKKKITYFKLNMNQFSVVDKEDFFKQTNELICSNLISTTVSKDKLFRDFRKLEGKLKTKQAEKKAIQIKKTELEKKVVEINQGVGNEAMNKIVQEKEAEIQNLKNQLKLPTEGAVETMELKTVLQEKEVLQTELQNTKAIVGTIRDEKDALEDQIKSLKEKVDKMTIVDPSLSLASELGILFVKQLELKNAQEQLKEVKKNLFDTTKLLTKSSIENENLRRQVEASRQSLKGTNFLLWDYMLKEVKRFKDHLIMLQDERSLVTTCLTNVDVVQKNMGDKPIQAQKAINFLNSQSKTQLQFAGIQEGIDQIAQAKKYIVKDALAKEVVMKANFLKKRDDQFKNTYLMETIFPAKKKGLHNQLLSGLLEGKESVHQRSSEISSRSKI